MPILVVLGLCASNQLPSPHSVLSNKLTEKRVIQRNRLDSLHIRIRDKLGINVEEHRHIDRLASIQPLLLEAETLNLAEIRRHLRRRHAVRRNPYDIFCRALVRRSVERQRRLAGQHSHFALLWRELPRQDIGGRAGEGDSESWDAGLGCSAGDDVLCVAGALVVDVDRLATPAGLLADRFVERDGSVGESDCAENYG